MDAKSLDKLLVIEQAAEVLRIHPATLYRWARAGRVPCIRMGARVIRFERRALERYLAQSSTDAHQGQKVGR